MALLPVALSLQAAELPALRVGTSGDYAPFSTVDAGQTRHGFDVELATRLARDLGHRVDFVPFHWPDLSAALASGRFDLAASGVTIRAERLLAGRFTRPYALSRATPLIRATDSARFASVEALNDRGVRIVVNRGGHLERLARTTFSRAQIEALDNNIGLADRVEEGGADVLITDSNEAPHFLARHPALTPLPPFSRDRKALLLRLDDPTLHAAVDRWLAEREKDGWLNELRRRWCGAGAALPLATAQVEAVVALVDQRLGLMPWVAAEKRKEGGAVEDPAREESVLARVRAAAARAGLDPEPVGALYAILIKTAKAVQRKAPAVETNASLGALRSMISELDERLVAEIGAARLALQDPGHLTVLRDSVDSLVLPGVDHATKERLASALTAAAGARSESAPKSSQSL